MAQRTSPLASPPATPALLAALQTLLAAHRPACGQARPSQRTVALVFARTTRGSGVEELSMSNGGGGCCGGGGGCACGR